MNSFLQGPDILNSEVEKALNSMKSGKASGIDAISSEMLQARGEFGTNTLTELCNNMYKNAYIPEDLRTSVFILLPKKQKAVECSDFRTISLMCHTLKLLLTVILGRISNKINSEVGKEQAGFRKNSGTREAIFCLRNLTETYIEMNKDIFACFIDYSKAFDTVGHDRLIDILRATEVDENDAALIASLYWNQNTRIRLGSEMSPSLSIKRGVRQGCVLSPALFNLYTEFIFRETNDIPGLKINGVNINNLRYADDTVLLAEDEKSLQDIVTAVKEESEKYGLMMNIKKTKVMVLTHKKEVPKAEIKINGETVEQVPSFTYLGQLITEDGRNEKEVKRRIALSKISFSKLNKILTSRHIRTETKLRLTKCYVWSIFMYGCETWTLTKQIEAKIEAYEMWTYRRILRISWKEKKPNKTVLKLMNIKKPVLLTTIKKKQLSYFGHTKRHDSLQKLILEGKVEGSRGRGRKRKTWRGNIAEMISMNINKAGETALDRDKWRRTMASNLFAETEPSHTQCLTPMRDNFS